MSKLLTPIVIETYQPNWRNKFRIEAFLIQMAIGRYISSIEHIGSTSVQGLAAKPIIDMLVGVKSLRDAPHFISLLTRLRYNYVSDYETDLPERRYLFKSKKGEDAFHLHMVEPQSDFYRRHLAFRDYLRSHPEAVNAYAELKHRLAREFGSDRAGYTDAKTEFIQSIECKALSPES